MLFCIVYIIINDRSDFYNSVAICEYQQNVFATASLVVIWVSDSFAWAWVARAIVERNIIYDISVGEAILIIVAITFYIDISGIENFGYGLNNRAIFKFILIVFNIFSDFVNYAGESYRNSILVSFALNRYLNF